MSTSIPDEALVEAVRGSSPDVRARLLRELLADYVQQGGRWPLPVSDRSNEVIAFLFPRPGGPAKLPPKLSPEQEAELNERLNHLDESRALQDYIGRLGTPGGSS